MYHIKKNIKYRIELLLHLKNKQKPIFLSSFAFLSSYNQLTFQPQKDMIMEYSLRFLSYALQMFADAKKFAGEFSSDKDFIQDAMNETVKYSALVILLVLVGLYVLGKVKEWTVRILDRLFYLLWEAFKIMAPPFIAILVYHVYIHRERYWNMFSSNPM